VGVRSRGGVAGTVKGGAQLLSDTTDLCDTCGSQALNMNATAQGSSATVDSYFDSASTEDIFVLMSGTYQFSFWAKPASGTPLLTAAVRRISQGGFNCGTTRQSLLHTGRNINGHVQRRNRLQPRHRVPSK